MKKKIDHGHTYLPKNIKCSKVWGKPSSVQASVAKQKYPLTIGLSDWARTTVNPVLRDLYL